MLKRKIVYEFIPTLGDGGAETLVKDYCLQSKELNVEIRPVVLWNTGASANIEQLNAADIRIEYIYQSQNTIIRAFNKFFGKIYVSWKLNRILKKTGSNVLHIHLALLNYAKRLSILNKEVYFFYTCHNIVPYYFPNKECVEYKAAKYLLDRNRLTIVALHDEMRRELNCFFEIDNCIVVHNGVNVDRFSNTRIDRVKKRKELNIPVDAFLLIHVGRFAKQKNHAFLVDIFHEVCKINPKAFLLMVGEGNLKDDIIQKLNDLNLDHQFIVLSKRNDVDELLKISDCFVLPSLFEGLGIVLIESQFSKTPTFCSNACPSDAQISNFFYPISLEESASCWAQKIVETKQNDMIISRIADYDMSYQFDLLVSKYNKHK